MKSKIWVAATIILIASMMLAACAPKEVIKTVEVEKEVVKTVEVEKEVVKEVEVTAVPTPKPQVTVVIFVGMGTGTDPSQVAVHKEIQDLFNSTHEKIQIEFFTSPWAERLTKYSTMLAADQPPDIVMPIGVGGISEYYKGWLDLSPYIERDSYDMSRFSGVTGEIHNYPGQGVLGLPMCVYPTGVFYNVDVFDAAGVDYPPAHYGEAYADGDPWTYEKLNEISKLLTLDANGNNAASPAFDPANIVQFGWNGWDWGNNVEWAAKWGDLNGTGVSPDGKTSLLNTPQYIDWMKFAKEQIWDEHIRANGEQAGAFYQNAGNPMESGMVGMWESHTWMGFAYPGWTAKFTWNIGAVPAGANGVQFPLVDADTAVVPAASKNPDEAWEVMKWFYEPAQYDRLIANYNCLPADTVSMSKWVEDMQAKYPGVDFGVFVEALDYIETYNHESWKPNYTKVNDEMGKAWSQIASGDNLDVEAVMKTAHEAVQKLLDDYWAANP